MFIEILFKILLFKGGVLIYAEHCMYACVRACMLILHTRAVRYFACDSHAHLISKEGD